MAKSLGAEFWSGHLKAWERSELTQVAYCVKHNLSIKSFGRWRSLELAAPPVSKPRELTLVPVSVGASTQSGTIRLYSPGGWRIEFPVSTGPWFSELLRQLP